MKKSTSKMVGGGKAATDNIIQVMIFENPEFGKIRIVTDRNGEPLFCGKDVCEVLGYKKSYEAVKQHVNGHNTVKRGIRVAIGKRADGSIAERLMNMLFGTETATSLSLSPSNEVRNPLTGFRTVSARHSSWLPPTTKARWRSRRTRLSP